MKIIITEDQLNDIMENGRSMNSKPAKIFDDLYGTKLSHKYKFLPYTERELQKKWDNFIFDDAEQSEFFKTFYILEKAFPYVDCSKLDEWVKFDIMCGMLSEYNPEDIIFFAVKGIKGYMNKAQDDLKSKLPADVVHNMQWVMSPGTIKKIKERFNIQ